MNYTEKGTPIQGHGPEFKMKFKYLADQAIKQKFLVYHDYAESPKKYCGMTITSHIMN